MPHAAGLKMQRAARRSKPPLKNPRWKGFHMDLKEVLGEELYNQVAAKLKGNDKVKLANLADGGYVGKEKFDASETTVADLKKQLESRDKDIAALKKSAGDNEDLTKQLNDLQAKYKTDTEALQSKISQNALNAALDLGITKAKGKNAKAVKALLDTSKLSLKDDGTVDGLGIGLILAESVMLGASAGLDFSAMQTKVKTTLTKILGVVGPIVAAIGIVLVLTCPKALPLGIGLIIAGGTMLGTAVGLNWDFVKDKVKSVLGDILAIISVASAAVGLILCLTDVGIPLGIALIIAGMKGTQQAATLSKDPIIQWAKDMVNGIIGIFESGVRR
ncbi:MAG TPA: hypothetical protein DG942_01840 [Ruminococcaceae bacterium]|nr:hypothetical protein [Oscillospiraceae bacterium]